MYSGWTYETLKAGVMSRNLKHDETFIDDAFIKWWNEQYGIGRACACATMKLHDVCFFWLVLNVSGRLRDSIYILSRAVWNVIEIWRAIGLLWRILNSLTPTAMAGYDKEEIKILHPLYKSKSYLHRAYLAPNLSPTQHLHIINARTDLRLWLIIAKRVRAFTTTTLVRVKWPDKTFARQSR